MLLNNITLVEIGETVSIEIERGLIKSVDNQPKVLSSQLSLNFGNAIAFPGLINSHDHLDFNLFPQFGTQIYNSYTEWGKHIHKQYKTEINKVLQIPIELRERWGIIKNLLAGVTTVVNHGEPVKTKERLINVFENYYCIHSVQFESKWKLKLNNPLKRAFPIVIHCGEGKDEAAHEEINSIIKWNYLRKRLVGIHGVAMDEKQANRFQALVWCPQSNYFLLDKTADIKRLINNTTILFGTDSTLTSNWDIWDHIKLARKTGMLRDEDLYQTLTNNAADVWKLNNKNLSPGQNADLVIARKKENTALDSFFAIDPEDILLVVHQGNIRLFDVELLVQLDELDISNFNKISINHAVKYIDTDVPGLMAQIRTHYKEAKFPIIAA